MAAVLIPLAAFAVEVVFIRQLKRFNAYIATGAIGLSFLLSLVGFLDYYFVEADGVSRPSTMPRREPNRPTGEHGGRAAERRRMTHRTVRSSGQASFDWVVLGEVGRRAGDDPAGRASRSGCPARRLHRQPAA